ncbi:MAG: hypothetical protein AVDCRST_MAG07-3030, partial [uncultured Frankineae bacterium]
AGPAVLRGGAAALPGVGGAGAGPAARRPVVAAERTARARPRQHGPPRRPYVACARARAARPRLPAGAVPARGAGLAPRRRDAAAGAPRRAAARAARPRTGSDRERRPPGALRCPPRLRGAPRPRHHADRLEAPGRAAPDPRGCAPPAAPPDVRPLPRRHAAGRAGVLRRGALAALGGRRRVGGVRPQGQHARALPGPHGAGPVGHGAALPADRCGRAAAEHQPRRAPRAARGAGAAPARGPRQPRGAPAGGLRPARARRAGVAAGLRAAPHPPRGACRSPARPAGRRSGGAGDL